LASSNIIAVLQRRAKALIIAFTATVLGAVAGLQIADLWTLRQQTLNNAQLRAANGASVVAEYVRGVRSPPTPGQSTGSAT
jgi:cytosine/uracil/thiamine/allantoin permease